MKTQRIYVLSAICLFAGLILFLIGFAMMGFNIMNFDTEPPYTSAIYDVKESIDGITIDEQGADVKFVRSEDGKVHIKYYENSRRGYNFSVKSDGKLYISSVINNDWTNSFGISVSTPTLTVMLPKDFSGDIKVDCTLGDIVAENICAASFSAESENGDVKLNGAIFSGHLTVDSELGDTEIYNVQVDRTAKLSAENGTLFAQIVKAADFYAESENGNVTLADINYSGSLFSESENGNIQLSNVSVGRSITLISENGEIRGNINGAVADFTYNCSARNGECNLPQSLLGGNKQLNAKSENGDIEIYMVTKAVVE